MKSEPNKNDSKAEDNDQSNKPQQRRDLNPNRFFQTPYNPIQTGLNLLLCIIDNYKANAKGREIEIEARFGKFTFSDAIGGQSPMKNCIKDAGRYNVTPFASDHPMLKIGGMPRTSLLPGIRSSFDANIKPEKFDNYKRLLINETNLQMDRARHVKSLSLSFTVRETGERATFSINRGKFYMEKKEEKKHVDVSSQCSLFRISFAYESKEEMTFEMFLKFLKAPRRPGSLTARLKLRDCFIMNYLSHDLTNVWQFQRQEDLKQLVIFIEEKIPENPTQAQKEKLKSLLLAFATSISDEVRNEMEVELRDFDIVFSEDKRPNFFYFIANFMKNVELLKFEEKWSRKKMSSASFFGTENKPVIGGYLQENMDPFPTIFRKGKIIKE